MDVRTPERETRTFEEDERAIVNIEREKNRRAISQAARDRAYIPPQAGPSAREQRESVDWFSSSHKYHYCST